MVTQSISDSLHARKAVAFLAAKAIRIAPLCQLLLARQRVTGQHKKLNAGIVCLPNPNICTQASPLGETGVIIKNLMGCDGNDAKQHATMLNITAMQIHTSD